MGKTTGKTESKQHETKTTKKEWYKHGWGLVAAILLFPFFIIWYAWAKSNWHENTKVIVTVASAIFIVIALVSSSTSEPPANSESSKPAQQSASQPTESPQEKAKREAEANKKPDFSAKVTTYAPMNPATLRFMAKVTNKGDKEGKFNCFVSAQDTSGTYKGYDVFTTDEILKPGKSDTFTGDLVITNEGAAYVTGITIDCDE